MGRPSTPILQRKGIVDEALAMIDESGLEKFSMPALARRLGVKTASLYYHFTDKSELLSGVARAVIRQAEPPNFAQDDDWANWMVEMAIGYRRAVMAHPHAAAVLVSHTPRRLIASLYEKGATILSNAGIPQELVLLLLDGVESLATASALMGTVSGTDTDDLGFGHLDEDKYPTLRSILDHSFRDSEDFLREQARSFIVGTMARAGLESGELFRVG
ncbi:hypothetical protein GCM10022261_01640 [Brevibacterium daeguense]|uniref:HTH tetR-type domain-containing protein n=1 Tax=Brevibacterium daeguense TaxID=909936 RepID=A0ABP8EF73_9MICO|nr:TetR/AcrR family transcriptional regulator [Brevibacterium daeguense]